MIKIFIVIIFSFLIFFSGPPRITDLRFDGNQIEMTCISVGQLVEQFEWYYNGRKISSDSLYFTQTQTILERIVPKYEHKLKGNTSDFIGQFVCRLTDGIGRFTEKTLNLFSKLANMHTLTFIFVSAPVLIC